MKNNKITKTYHNVWIKHYHGEGQVEIEKRILDKCSKKEKNSYLAAVIVNIYRDLDSLYYENKRLKNDIKELKKERYED